MLTQGKVDGEGGRGSYAGLADTLTTIATHICSKQIDIFEICEDMLYVDNSNTLATVTVVCQDKQHVSQHTRGISQSAPKAATVGRDVDILVSGVWLPVLDLLADRFPGMFSAGIANTFARCYLGVHCFLASLCRSVDASPAIRRHGEVARRIHCHPATRVFHEKWKLSLYMQVSEL